MKNIKHKIKIAGFGGQGILFLGKFFSEVANEYGFFTTWLPSYGPEMRGGTANCSVIISDSEISSPVFENPSVLIALNQPSFEKFFPLTTKDALIVIEKDLVKTTAKNVIKVNSIHEAEKIGNKKISNMIIAKIVLQKLNLFDLEIIKTALMKSDLSKEMIDLNMKAFTTN